MNTEIAKRLEDLRSAMRAQGVDGFIIPRADEYQGEYIPDSANRLHWISGFTGSAGIAIVLMDVAAVLSDGRYTIQLRSQIDSSLFMAGDSTKISAAEWLAKNAKDMAIGYDPKLHTPRELKAYADKGVSMVPVPNLVDAVWLDRPAAPSAKVEIFPLDYAGQSAPDKLDIIAQKIADAKADAAVVALPDSIAWLLNIRSSDISHIPVALSYGVAHKNGTFDWFIDEARIGEEVRKTFGNRVMLLPPVDLERALASLQDKTVLLDERRTSVWFAQTLKEHGVEAIDIKDPIVDLKACKNKAEQESMRRAHIRDGVAVTKFLHWFAKESIKERLTELEVDAKLESFRREAKEYRDSSFDTIAGFGANGAIVHYRADEKSNARIERWNMLLLDSGAQYLDGTTDITRTIAVGEPTREMKENFTSVLKAHIAVATARFPQGTTGAQIDALARAPLWQRGLDYAHGTGHGVGCYLSVHEEAANISPRGSDAIQPGMILSNEPGYYKEGEYGIRIENLILAREDGSCEATGKKMLSFETLTFVPIDKNLIVPDMLSPDEAFWLAQYHKTVLSNLSPYLEGDVLEWLKSATQ